MATRIAHNTNRAQFENMINRWEARWRLRRIVQYLPRVLMAAIGIAIVVTLILGIFRVLSPVMMVGVVSGGIAAMTVLLSGAFGIFGKRDIEAARQFDKVFGLQERISTALEIMDERIRTAPEIAEKQVADAMSHARDVDPRKYIKIEVNWLEWLGVVSLSLVLVIILGAYILFGIRRDGEATAATQTAVQQAAADVRDITEDIATDSALTDEERTNLLETLEVTLDDLSETPPEAEDSFVALSELESDLSQLAEAISEEVAFDSSAMAAAAEALQNPADTAPAEIDIPPNLSDELEAMQQDWSELSPEQQAQLQQQMSSAAQLMREAYPELAQQLQEMAESRNANGQPNISEEQFQELLDDLASAENQLQERSEAAQSLEQSAQQAQQAAENIAQADAQQQQSQQSQEGQQSQSGQPQDQSQNQDGTGQQQGQNGQQQPGQSDTAVESQNPADANASAPSQSQDGQQQAPSGQPQDQQSNADEGGSEGGGAGEGEATSRQDGLSDSNQSPSGQNDADGQGETTYEEIYAPNSINTQGQGNVELETDDSDAPVVEVDSQNRPTGEAQVPYNQVFRNYENAANHALENDYVPLGMQDVVRDYFSSLQPTGDGE